MARGPNKREKDKREKKTIHIFIFTGNSTSMWRQKQETPGDIRLSCLLFTSIGNIFFSKGISKLFSYLLLYVYFFIHVDSFVAYEV